MQLSYPVQRFIEDNIALIEEGEFGLFFYCSMFALTNKHSVELIHVFMNVLEVRPEKYIKDALIDWCKDSVALQNRKKVSVAKLLQQLPHFGYDNITFYNMFCESVKLACPNKTVLPNLNGEEYIVEKI